jgi:hypothetical protein
LLPSSNNLDLIPINFTKHYHCELSKESIGMQRNRSVKHLRQFWSDFFVRAQNQLLNLSWLLPWTFPVSAKRFVSSDSAALGDSKAEHWSHSPPQLKSMISLGRSFVDVEWPGLAASQLVAQSREQIIKRLLSVAKSVKNQVNIQCSLLIGIQHWCQKSMKHQDSAMAG